MRLVRGLVITLVVWALAGDARAETNPTPIAVPLLNANLTDPQPGSPYPSTFEITEPRIGPGQRFLSTTIVLHAVTHPCPEDLALLLVHNNTEKYLLMSNAGSCRALQGTDLVFRAGVPVLPDADPSTAPHGPRLFLDASNYGVVPVFPAPAPPGPYTLGMPPTAVLLQGSWQLYVMDTRPGNRGVIAGGWSIVYDNVLVTSLPIAAIPDFGPAGTYPILFDARLMAAAARVRSITLHLTLQHAYPDDLRIVLEAPSGATAAVMINAGGGTPVNSNLMFWDIGATHVPDEEPIPAISPAYKPGSVYDTSFVSLPAPAPPPPYGTSFAALNGEPVAGFWKLWVFDDSGPGGGSINGGLLIVETERRPLLSIHLPTADSTYTTNQPFLPLQAEVLDLDADASYSATWRSVVNGEFYDAGIMTLRPGTNFLQANVPLKKGSNVITTSIITRAGLSYTASDTLTVDVPEFTYYLSEGATGGFFDNEVTLANPGTEPATVAVDFLPEHGPPVPYAARVLPDTPLQILVDDSVPNDAVSTVVRSTDGVPLAVERTMSWDGTGYGGHGGTSTRPQTRWLFAEGSQGFFSTFVLLANDNGSEVTATIRFLLEGGGVITHPVTLPPRQRVTIHAGDIPALVDRSFGIDVTATQPIIVERSMYFPRDGARVFDGGTESAGVNEVSRRWFLAEGATGPFFECYILLTNPDTAVAHTTVTYLLPGGETIVRTVDVPANGRTTINVETVDARLANTPVSTTIVSDVGIIAERSMYWPDISSGWREAHNSVGVTEATLRWGVADGRIGGPRGYATYILLANPNSASAEVQVAFMKGGVRGPSQTFVLAPTSRHNVWVNNDFPALGDGLFSAEVRVLNYQPIVVEKAMYWNSGAEIWAAGTGVVATPLPPP
jgi:subtilisin-like proprotein convertase family protein